MHSPRPAEKVRKSREGGTEIWSVSGTAEISDRGRFSLMVPVNPSIIEATEVWYELTIDANDDGLEPDDVFPNRVPVLSVPFALLSADSKLLSGSSAEAYSTDHEREEGLVGKADVGHVHDAVYWQLTGNAWDPMDDFFLGSVNDVTVELRVGNTPALRLEPTAETPNLIGGHSSNGVLPGAIGATIGGGGREGDPNQVTGPNGTVGGGSGNTATDWATVAGGQANSASGSFTTVGGGWMNAASNNYASVLGGRGNTASGETATVAGGRTNCATDQYAVVGGGAWNTASGYASVVSGGGGLDGYQELSGNTASGSWSTVGGGTGNVASSEFATIAGGYENHVDALASVVSGGSANSATAAYATVGGGGGNRASAYDSTISGGASNRAADIGATVGGGDFNRANGLWSTIGGGGGDDWEWPGTGGNVVEGDWATIAGGTNNRASGLYACVAGGVSNSASGPCSTIGGGGGNDWTLFITGGNITEGTCATISGGSYNRAGGSFAVVPGGRANAANGDYSLAAGNYAKASHEGAFVWADNQNYDFNSSRANEFSVRCTGGALFISGILNGFPAIGVKLLPGSGAWAMYSDRNGKDNITPADGQEVLDRLSGVQISTWNYKTQDASIHHMGPMAQDFYAAFGLGEDERHISTIDTDGVALAAIQGLHQLVREKDAQLAKQQQQISSLEARVKTLEHLISASVEKGSPIKN